MKHRIICIAGLALLLVIVGGVCAPGPNSVTAQEPPIRLVDGETINLPSWAAIRSGEGVPVLLQNLSADTLAITVTVGGLHPIQATGSTIPIRILGEARITLAPAETQAIRLAGSSGQINPPEPGTYAGLLLVQVDEAVVTTAQVRLLVPSPSSNGVEPLFDSRSYRLSVLPGQVPGPIYLPIEPIDLNQLTIQADKPLGMVSDSDRFAYVYWDGTAKAGTEENANYVQSVLAFKAALVPGEYTGSIKLPGGKDVQLSLLVQHHWLLAIVTLLIGFWLTWAIKNYTGVKAQIDKLLKQEAQLRVDFGKECHPDQNHYNYCFEEAFTGFMNDIRTKLSQPKWRMLVVLDEKDATYESAVAGLDIAAKVVDGWNKFPASLAALENALSREEYKKYRVEQGPQRAPFDPRVPFRSDAPAFLEPARHLLIGSKITSLDAFLKRSSAVEQATKLAKVWPKLDEGVAEYSLLLNQIDTVLEGLVNTNQPPDQVLTADRLLCNEARRLLSEVKWELQHVENLNELTKKSTTADLDRAEQILAQLRFYLERPAKLEQLKKGESAPQKERIAGASVEIWVGGLIRGLLGQPAPGLTDAERVAFFQARQRWWDVGLILLYGSLALYTGMNQLYIGHPFGTPLTYVQALLWGIGTKVTLDTAYTFLDRFAGRMTQV